MPPQIGETARTARSTGERLGDFLFYAVALLLVYLVYQVFEPFLVPLGWAGVLAVVFHSWNARIEGRWGRNWAALLSTTGVTVILVVPVLLLMMMFVREGLDATRSVQASVAAGEFGWFSRAWGWIAAHVPAWSAVNLSDLVRQSASRVGEYLASELGAVLRNVVLFVFELFVTLFALFYFLRDGDRILDLLRRLLPFDEPVRERMLAEARELIFASVTSSLVIAAVQGFICGGAFGLVGLTSPVFWGVVMGFLSLLPVVGAWPVWIPAAIWLLSTGHVVRGLILVGLCAGVGSMVDNILRPVLLGGRASLNALLVFISVLGGIAVFGVLGVVLGPIVVATAVVVLDVYAGKGAPKEGARAGV